MSRPYQHERLPPDLAAVTGAANALGYAEDVYRHRLRRANRDVGHAIAVAELLAADGQPAELVVAGLLHDVLEDTTVAPRELRERFGGHVAAVVEALTQDERLGAYGDRKAALRRQVVAAGREAAIVALADKLAKLQRAERAPKRRRLAHYRAMLESIEQGYGPSRLGDLLRERLDGWPVP